MDGPIADILKILKIGAQRYLQGRRTKQNCLASVDGYGAMSMGRRW